MEVIVDEDNQSTDVVVPDYQLSLAIGKRGQNAISAKLTGWKIDIKSETDARDAGIYPVIESEELKTSFYQNQMMKILKLMMLI